MEVQLGFFDAILDLLGLDLRFILAGIVLIGVSLYWLQKRKMLTIKISIVLILFYYYLTILLDHIVGTPTIKELICLSALGAIIGYLCFKFIMKLKDKKFVNRNEGMVWMPILYLAGVFIITFIRLFRFSHIFSLMSRRL